MQKQQKLVFFDAEQEAFAPANALPIDGFFWEKHFTRAVLNQDGGSVGYVRAGKLVPLSSWRTTVQKDGRIKYFAEIGCSYTTLQPVHNPAAVAANALPFAEGKTFDEFVLEYRPSAHRRGEVFWRYFS